MYIIWIALEKLMQEYIKGEPFSILEKKVVSFEVWLVGLPVENDSMPSNFLHKFCEHSLV